MSCIYVIRCANAKYYVGRTIDVVSRYNQHRHGLGSKWTKAHQPLDGIIELLADSPFQELVTTLLYMSKYGIDNVRGGPWTELVLSETEIKTIKEMMRSEGFARKEPLSETAMVIDMVEPDLERKGKLWKSHEENDLVIELNQAMPLSDMAKRHGRTEGSLKSRVVSIAKRLREGGSLNKDIGNTLNLVDDDVTKCLCAKLPDLVHFRRNPAE